MKHFRFSMILNLAAGGLISSGVLLGTQAHAQAIPTVQIDGSSTVYPVTEGIAEDFQKSQKGKVRVTVGISGTGGGFKKFCRGEIDVADASRPILKKEMEECAKTGVTYYELPVAFDALTVVVNPQNAAIKQLSVAELKKIWSPESKGTVMKWSDVNPAFGSADLKLYGPGSDSGTFDYFTEAINGKSKASRSDYTASEDDNVLVQGVSRDKGALGYFGLAYYLENQKKLKAVAIVNKEGKAVLPSEQSVISGEYNPLARPLFIYVSTKSYEKPEVKAFVEYYLKQAASISKEVKYVPLPAKIYAAVSKNLSAKKAGTVFGGVADVAVTIEEIATREAKH